MTAPQHLSAVQHLAAGRTVGFASGPCFVIVRAPSAAGPLCLDGEALFNRRPAACSLSIAQQGSLQPGMRFEDADTGLELVCTQVGRGRVLTFAGRDLVRMDPTSDERHAPRHV